MDFYVCANIGALYIHAAFLYLDSLPERLVCFNVHSNDTHMTTMIPGKKKFPRYASFEELHEDNQKWINAISDWKREIDQLYFYLIELKLNQRFSSLKGLYPLEKKLLHQITTNELDIFNQLIQEHEHQLSAFKGEPIEEESYRRQHLTIACHYRRFKLYIKLLKREMRRLLKQRSYNSRKR